MARRMSKSNSFEKPSLGFSRKRTTLSRLLFGVSSHDDFQARASLSGGNSGLQSICKDPNGELSELRGTSTTNAVMLFYAASKPLLGFAAHSGQVTAVQVYLGSLLLV